MNEPMNENKAQVVIIECTAEHGAMEHPVTTIGRLSSSGFLPLAPTTSGSALPGRQPVSFKFQSTGHEVHHTQFLPLYLHIDMHPKHRNVHYLIDSGSCSNSE